MEKVQEERALPSGELEERVLELEKVQEERALPSGMLEARVLELQPSPSLVVMA